MKSRKHPLVPAVVAACAVGVLSVQAQAQDEDTLYIFNWSQYMDPEIIEQFEEEYGVRVVENYYNSLSEMFAQLQAGGASQYDIVVPSNYFIPRLANSDLLMELDHDQIPNMENLSETFIDPDFDPGNRYSVAYQWGTTGLIYREDMVDDSDGVSWGLLFDPEMNPDRPFAILGGDGQVSMGAAAAYLGHGYDTTDHDAWREAGELLLETRRRDNFVGFEDGTPMLRQITQGVIHAGMTYNADYVFFALEDPEDYENIRFAIPEEGAELWVDNMAIPKDAPNPDLAHQFINYILDAEIGAQLSNWTYYPSPNEAAEPMLDEILLESPSMPTDEEMERVHFTPSLSGDDLHFFQQVWSDVRQR